MAKFRKKPVVVDALCFTGENYAEVVAFLRDEDQVLLLPNGVGIKTLEGQMLASKGDWIIRGVAGELYPCRPDIFARTYQAEED